MSNDENAVNPQPASPFFEAWQKANAPLSLHPFAPQNEQELAFDKTIFDLFVKPQEALSHSANIVTTIDEEITMQQTQQPMGVIDDTPRLPNMLQYATLHPGSTCIWVEQDHARCVEAFRIVIEYMKSHDISYERIDYITRKITLKLFVPPFKDSTEKPSVLYFYSNLSPHYMRGLQVHWFGVNRGVEGIGTLYADIIRHAQLGLKDTIAVLAHAPLDCYMTSLE